jgi:hypothetical protein
MKTVRLIQIGDIHFPESSRERRADVMDPGVSDRFVHQVTIPKLTAAMRALHDVIEKSAVAGLLICGDLTSKGDHPGYASCVDFLVNNLTLNDPERWTTNQIAVVPGNHDINRRSINPTGDLFLKFEPLKHAWETVGLPIFPTNNVRVESVAMDDALVTIFSMNSCVGCGELRCLPGDVVTQLEGLISSETSDWRLFGEQLDTPAFAEEHIDELLSKIKSLNPKCLPVILAHHNLLPQALTRVQVYTETINSGAMRSRLCKAGKSVIYCHGHTHTDPVEIVTCAQADAGNLVCIAAPEFSEGFNVLDFIFSTKNEPIGCQVTRLHSSDDGAFESTPGAEIRIPLNGANKNGYSCDARIYALLSAIPPNDFYRFSEILKFASETGFSTEVIIELLKEAEWVGMVWIQNGNAEPENWQIKKTHA